MPDRSQPRPGGSRRSRREREDPTGRQRSPREHRRPKPKRQLQTTTPASREEPRPKICRKCGGRMFPTDWISQRYGLCLGWRCQKCKDKVLARSLPFKGLRKRRPDPDELQDRVKGHPGKQTRSE